MASQGPLSRALAVLNAIAASEHALSTIEISERANLSAMATGAQLRALCRAGLVEQADDSGGYRPGPAAQHLEALLAQSHSLLARVHPVLVALARETDETATYNALSHDRKTVTAVATVYGSAPLQYEVPLGQSRQLVAGASSRAVLAFLDDETQRAVLAAQLRPPGTSARRRLVDELSAIRAQGYSVVNDEQLPGAVGIAVPVFATGCRVAGSLSLTVPDLRLATVPIKKVVQVLLAQAAALTYRLGGVAVAAKA